MFSTGPQQSRPMPLRPLSVKLPWLNAARVSSPTTIAILRMSSRSKVAAHDGPEGNDVEQRPALVQLDIMEE